MAAHLLFKLGQFRENGEFIDVRLKVDKSIFPAHRNVLAANSDYFHAMFTNGMMESNQEVIELKDENLMYRSNRSFNMPPPGHLTPLTSRGGGNLIIRVFQGVGNLIPML